MFGSNLWRKVELEGSQGDMDTKGGAKNETVCFFCPEDSESLEWEDVWEEGQNWWRQLEREEGSGVKLPGILQFCFVLSAGLVIQKQLTLSLSLNLRGVKRSVRHEQSLLQPWGFREGQVRHPLSQIQLQGHRNKRGEVEREKERETEGGQSPTRFCS